MTLSQHEAMEHVIREVVRERLRQHETHGQQELPSFSSPWPLFSVREEVQRRKNWNDHAAEHGFEMTYEDIFREEVAEVRAERDPEKLRAELIQVAAVCVQWAECLDRRARKMAEGER